MIIAFGGPDGCGKTTIAKLIVKDLRRKGYPVAYVWLRYPRFFSFIPLLLSRMLNLTIVYEIDGLCKHKYHDFRRIPGLGVLYELLLILDYTLYRFIKVTIPRLIGYIVVVDRYVIDIAVDLLVERGSLTRFTLSYLSKEIRRFRLERIIMADEEVLLRRRRDNMCNLNLRSALALYTYLCRVYKVPIIQNNSAEDLFNIVSRITGSLKNVRVHTDSSIQFIRAVFFRYKYLIYFSNFVFQGMGYMWKAEFVFRLLLQAAITFLIYMYLKVNILLAVFMSHLLLYILYGNPLVLRKLIDDREPNPHEIIQGLRKLVNVEKKCRKCLAIYVIGSLSRDPLRMFKKRVDIDARVVPNSGIKCLLISLIVSLYLKAWFFFKKIPLDLYVKASNDPEFQRQSFAPCSSILERVLSGA